MSRIWNVCLMVLVVSGLSVTGCERDGGDEEKTKGQKAEKAGAEEPKEAEEGDEEKGADEEQAADFSQEDYVQASVALSCIDSNLGEDQVEDRETVEENVLGKYGFDQESYEQAEEQFADNDDVDSAIETQLEECDEEQAREYAGLEAADEEGGDESGDDQKKAKPAPTPAYVGRLSAEKENASGFGRAQLTVTVQNDFSANGKFSGMREGKGFRVALDGKVTKDNKLSLSGTEGKNNVEVSGTLRDSGATADVSGSIWETQFSLGMNLE